MVNTSRKRRFCFVILQYLIVLRRKMQESRRLLCCAKEIFDIHAENL